MIIGAHSVIVLVRDDDQHCVVLQCARPGVPRPDVTEYGPWESHKDAAKRLREVVGDLADKVARARELAAVPGPPPAPAGEMH